MIVRVQAGPDDGPPVAEVVDAADLDRLHVALDGVTEAEATTALWSAGLGHLSDPDTAWLSVAGLTRAVDPETLDRQSHWRRTLELAATHGWVSPDGQLLRAHVVRT